MHNNVKLTVITILFCLLIFQDCYGANKTPSARGAETRAPQNGQLYFSNIPSYFSPPTFHDIVMGYSGNNIMGVNKSGKNILEWIYDEKYLTLSKIKDYVKKSCNDRGYNISAASNIKIELDKPLDNVYMIFYSYEANCW